MRFWFRFKKGKTEEKTSPVTETASAYGTSDFSEPAYEQIPPETVQQLYDQSSLLKRYVKIITDECLRYEFRAVPKKEYEDNKEALKQVQELNDLFDSCNAYETLSEIREKYLKDLLLYGYAGVELLSLIHI